VLQGELKHLPRTGDPPLDLDAVERAFDVKGVFVILAENLNALAGHRLFLE
jgi:hypothetical protein